MNRTLRNLTLSAAVAVSALTFARPSQAAPEVSVSVGFPLPPPPRFVPPPPVPVPNVVLGYSTPYRGHWESRYRGRAYYQRGYYGPRGYVTFGVRRPWHHGYWRPGYYDRWGIWVPGQWCR